VRRPAALAAVATALVPALAGCGSSSVSAHQLRTGAARACTVAGRRLSRIPAPHDAAGAAAFLHAGITALGPELMALDRLSPTPQLAAPYGRARSATERELAALHSTLHRLSAGEDPVVAIKTLQQELAPLERQASAAWRALGVPGCLES